MVIRVLKTWADNVEPEFLVLVDDEYERFLESEAELEIHTGCSHQLLSTRLVEDD